MVPLVAKASYKHSNWLEYNWNFSEFNVPSSLLDEGLNLKQENQEVNLSL